MFLGLAVVCWRTVQRRVSGANPLSLEAEAAQQAAAGAVADGELLVSAGVLYGDVDSDSGALVAAVGQGGHAEGGGPVEGGSAWARAAVMSWTWPGSASDVQIGRPPGSTTAWTLPPGWWCLPE